MRVLHVLDMSLPVVAGYTSRARAILEHQANMGIDAMALTSLRQGEAEVDCEHVGGIRHYRTRVSAPVARLRAAPLAREIVDMAALGGRILEVAREARVHVLHAHSPVLCGIPAHLAARRLDLPSVYEIRAFWEDAAANQGKNAEGSPRYAAVRAMETRLTRSVDAVVALCEGIRSDLLARGVPSDRVFTVPNGVNTDRFRPRPRDEALADRFGFRGKTVVGYIGTLFRFEGVAMLLDALARLTRERDDVRGLVVGHGETFDELREQHAKLRLGDRVVLTGKVDPSEVGAFYSIADVLCYPRERHRITDLTTPLKPLEAMSMGKAVVASDVGGLRELVRDRETGFCFRAGDTTDMLRVLGEVVSDAQLRRSLGERARSAMVRERDWKAIAAKYVDVYAAASEKRAAGRKAA
jgi:glycogen synthase